AQRDSRFIAHDARVNQVRETDVRVAGEASRNLVDHDRRADTDRGCDCLIEQLLFGVAHAILADLLSDAFSIELYKAENVPLRRDVIDLFNQKRDLARHSATAEDDDVLHKGSNEVPVTA